MFAQHQQSNIDATGINITQPARLNNVKSGSSRFLGVDIGAETIKIVEINKSNGDLSLSRWLIQEHHKQPVNAFRELASNLELHKIDGINICGRLSRLLKLPHIPTQQAQLQAAKFLLKNSFPFMVVCIGSRGFSVLEAWSKENIIFRENSKCSQGTGNFLKQLVERFGLSVEDASKLCAHIQKPAILSGRCPVILKTDVTHLANKGESRAEIIAGLFDAMCENVLTLIKDPIPNTQVILAGGLARAERVKFFFKNSLAKHGLKLVDLPDDACLYFDALGAAILASESPFAAPKTLEIIPNPSNLKTEKFPPLSQYLPKIKRLQSQKITKHINQPYILGFDIGSTGSKCVVIGYQDLQTYWEGYTRTSGNPVGAAHFLWQEAINKSMCLNNIVAIGVTGSGREIVSYLLKACYGNEKVFVLNEIAAHAEGALYYDRRVDTIFEIGGQDAKFIRLQNSKVIESAMNEACSAGTGSFIEEQGQRFPGNPDPIRINQLAMSAPYGISLGQHCSVFMAEVIDECAAAGIETPVILAGLYDSVIQNYLNRVKGNRSIGDVIFCQGMPFTSDALAAAVVRQTNSEVIIPPSPGMMGALGIALLTRKKLQITTSKPIDPNLFLTSKITSKSSFICHSTTGCGGTGNRCRIDVIEVADSSFKKKFFWGGACSLYDKGVNSKKLPDSAPNPFIERENWIFKFCKDQLKPRPDARSIKISDEYILKDLFPFFAMFLYECGFNIIHVSETSRDMLKDGIRKATVPFCAPLQLYHGLVYQMLKNGTEFVFMPNISSTIRPAALKHSATCPLCQASPDIVRWILPEQARERIISPVIDFGPQNYQSQQFKASCMALGKSLSVPRSKIMHAFDEAVKAQTEFEKFKMQIGSTSLQYCKNHNLPAIVVLGRSYTIYNQILNSNVPTLLRELGAIAIPADCYPLQDNKPLFKDIFWGYGRQLLRTAYKIKNETDVFAAFCSNYSCGPDSFIHHFLLYTMQGKPFVLIETDGHSGDAGTKTRLEAFLYCVDQYRSELSESKSTNTPKEITIPNISLNKLKLDNRKLLVPWLGTGTECVVALLQGSGFNVECLPEPDIESLKLGRKFTSGKECLPACLTLGSLLQRLQVSKPSEKLAFLMPRPQGPCRLGAYSLLDQIVLNNLNLNDKVKIIAPLESEYFSELSPGLTTLLFCGIIVSDYLRQLMLDTRPVETSKGAAEKIFAKYFSQLLEIIEYEAKKNISLLNALRQVLNGKLFGLTDLLRQASQEFNLAKHNAIHKPTVLLVGEIYIRLVPFANNFIIQHLESLGFKVRLAPFNEWLDYLYSIPDEKSFMDILRGWIMSKIRHTIKNTTQPYGFRQFPRAIDSIKAATPYLNDSLKGEAILTLGLSLEESATKQVDGIVIVGPLECMPTKIAQAQAWHAVNKTGIPNVTLLFNGEPLDEAVLENFAFEVKAKFNQDSPILPKPKFCNFHG